MKYLAPIVEGHGEVESLPALLYRIAHASGYSGQLIVNAPIRVKSGSFINDPDYFAKQVFLAAEKAAQRGGGVLVVLDCEDDCPAILGPKLLTKAQAVRSGVPMMVTLAFREFESWFITAAQSLRGFYGLPSDLNSPDDVDGIRDAKGWLSRRMNSAYDPIIHQLEFCRKFDLDQAKACHSFERFFARVSTFLSA